MIDVNVYKYDAYALYRFDSRYAIGAELLGYTASVMLNESCWMEVMYPICKEKCPNAEFHDYQLMSPLYIPDVLIDTDEWGCCYRMNSGTSLPVEFRSGVIAIHLRSSVPFIKKKWAIEASVKKVMEMYASLLELRKPDAVRYAFDENIPGKEVQLFAFSYKDENGQIKPSYSIGFCTEGRTELLTKEDVNFAIERCVQNLTIPFLYLNNAYRSKNQLDNRSCVLNCATACELVVRGKVEAYFTQKNIPDEMRTYVIGKVSGFCGYRDLCKKLRIVVDCANEVQSKVMNVRNRIIHGGYVPTDEEVLNSLKTCRIFLEKMSVEMTE